MSRHVSGVCLAALRMAALAVTLGAALGGSAKAQTQPSGAAGFPNKPVKIILGFAAGTGPDIIVRMLGQKLSEAWGNVGVIIDNKPGAAGQIAAVETARSAPDGYTLMLAELAQMSILPHVYRKLPYDPQRDFVPVSQVVNTGFVLLIDPKRVPARNLREFVEWSRKQPKGIFLGSFGAGTPGHFAAYMFGDATKIATEVVHYKATADAIVGLSSGDVHGAFVSASLAVGQLKGGKLIALANTAATRSPVLPDIATMNEQGYPGLELTGWAGIVAPAKTPPEIVDKLSADINKALNTPDIRAKLEEMGNNVAGTTRQEFARIIAADSLTWGKAVAATGFKLD